MSVALVADHLTHQVDGKFIKGHHIGRPQGPMAWWPEFLRELRHVEKAQRKPFLRHAIERAYENDKLIPPILDRLIPAFKVQDGEQGGSITFQVIMYGSAPVTVGVVTPPTNGNGHGDQETEG